MHWIASAADMDSSNRTICIFINSADGVGSSEPFIYKYKASAAGVDYPGYLYAQVQTRNWRGFFWKIYYMHIKTSAAIVDSSSKTLCIFINFAVLLDHYMHMKGLCCWRGFLEHFMHIKAPVAIVGSSGTYLYAMYSLCCWHDGFL